jgi:hypothetical protein
MYLYSFRKLIELHGVISRFPNGEVAMLSWTPDEQSGLGHMKLNSHREIGGIRERGADQTVVLKESEAEQLLLEYRKSRKGSGVNY